MKKREDLKKGLVVLVAVVASFYSIVPVSFADRAVPTQLDIKFYRSGNAERDALDDRIAQVADSNVCPGSRPVSYGCGQSTLGRNVTLSRPAQPVTQQQQPTTGRTVIQEAQDAIAAAIAEGRNPYGLRG